LDIAGLESRFGVFDKASF